MLIPQRESEHVEQRVDARRLSGMWFHKEKTVVYKVAAILLATAYFIW